MSPAALVAPAQEAGRPDRRERQAWASAAEVGDVVPSPPARCHEVGDNPIVRTLVAAACRRPHLGASLQDSLSHLVR